MDHSHMDHSHMAHMSMEGGDMGGGHGDHGGMADMCNMNMLFTWDTNNLCIVFRFWHVRGLPSLLFSLALIVLIGIGYEFLRDVTRRYELSVNKRLETAPRHTQSDASKRAHLIKSALYAVQTLYAFMMMLVFMTYNGWVMVAITIGNFLGYYIFGGASQATKETACH